MKRRISLLSHALLLASLGTAVEAAAASVRWQGVVGIIQAGSTVGSGTGQVAGAPGPWSATSGNARADFDTGRLAFRVRGLVLAAGNSIGTPGPVTAIVGTLVCDTDGSAGGDSTLVDTPVIPLSSVGSASFEGSLGPFPAACTDEPDIAFLIRAAGFGAWLANGAVRTSQ